VTFSPDGKRLASGSEKTVRLWDMVSCAELAALLHPDPVTSLTFSPDGRRIVSGSKDGTFRLWDTASGVELAVLHGHKGRVTSVAFSPDGAGIVSRSSDKAVFWDARSGEYLDCVPEKGDGLAIAATSKSFPFRGFSLNGETHVLNAKTGSLVARFPEALADIITYPNGLTWLGIKENHLHILTIEDGTDPRAQSPQ
jgi:WD40 repeat protein